MTDQDHTILVTGGSGFIGSHFVRLLLTDSICRVINLDKLTYAGNQQNLNDVKQNERYTFVEGDISDIVTVREVLKKFAPQYIVNFAAESHVDRSIHGHAKEFINTNVYGVFTLLEAMKDIPVERFLHISTDEVYGSLSLGSKELFTEETPYAPRSPYAASKASGDMLARSYFHTYGLPVIVTHSSNNYGSHQYPEKLIPYFSLRALANKTLPLYGDGKNVRDWIHVSDNVRAIKEILYTGSVGEAYNIGGGNEYSNKEIAERILDILNKPKTLIEHIADRPGHDRRYALDSTKIKRELGWEPKISFEEGLRDAVLWYKDNPDWIEQAIARLEEVNTHIDL